MLTLRTFDTLGNFKKCDDTEQHYLLTSVADYARRTHYFFSRKANTSSKSKQFLPSEKKINVCLTFSS